LGHLGTDAGAFQVGDEEVAAGMEVGEQASSTLSAISEYHPILLGRAVFRRVWRDKLPDIVHIRRFA